MTRRSPSRGLTWQALNDIDLFRRVLTPLLHFNECESSAFLRAAIAHAQAKDLAEVSPLVDLLPTVTILNLCATAGRGSLAPEALSTTEDRNKAATNAAKSLVSARSWFEHAATATDTAVRPTMYYYGALSFYKFITFCLVKTSSGKGSHGLSLSCDSDGHDFSKAWPRQSCRVAVEDSGDFPFFVDTLAAAGWPSLFSRYRLHQDSKGAAWSIRVNPFPLATAKVSLDYLCNFNFHEYTSDPKLVEWLEGSDIKKVEAMTTLLIDFVIVFAASSLDRYYIPAWSHIVQADRSDIYNRIRMAYQGVSMDAPSFFADQNPFRYSFRTVPSI